MSSIIETNAAAAEILSSIARLEAELTQVKAACTAAGLTISPAKKSRAKKSAGGEEKPKAAPNVWIRFTQQVDGALKAAAISVGAATVSKQFASSLKDIKAYAEWTDIVAAWSTWEKPEQSKMSSKKSSAASSEAEDGAEPKVRKPRAKLTEEEKAARKAERDAKKEPKERKPRAKLTEEEKAERKVARDAKKADSAAASAAASAVASAAEESSTEEPAAKKERKPRAKMTDAQKLAAKEKREAKKAAAPAALAAALPASSPSSDGEEAKPAAAAKPKLVLKKKVVEKPSFTMEQLADFDTFSHEGMDYGRNIRGDVSTQDGAYAGHWDGKTIVQGPEPADWEAVMRFGQE